MSVEWPLVELSELANEITVGFVGSMTQEYVDGGVPFFRSKNISAYEIDWEDIRYISSEFHMRISKSTLRAGDVAIVRTGKPGIACVIPDSIGEANCSDVVIVRVDDEKLSAHYLTYFMNSVATHQVSSRLVGAVQQHFNVGSAKKISIPLPPREEQERIVNILKTLDDKIRVNRQINQTLEQIAQTIFKSWFVDFEPVKAKVEAKAAGRDPERAAMCAISGKLEPELDQLPTEHYQQLAATAALFPDELVESELGLIPVGWEVRTLKDLTVKIGSGATPRGGSGVYLDEGTALIRSQNVYDSEFAWDGLARISDSAASQLSGVEVKREDVLLNITGASILRTCVVVPDVLPARVNQHVAIIRAKAGIPARYIHLHLLQQKTKDYLMGLNAGASREAVTKGHIESVPTLCPRPEVLKCFGDVTNSVFCEIDQLASQSRTLATLRDTLLPKLLSGELRPPSVPPTSQGGSKFEEPR
jgi:type I restriction enzyme S subunit